MFFVGENKIVKIDRLPGESNKTFFKKGYYVANYGVTNDTELKKVVAQFNLLST
tara:strand:- start:103 stop:264 length:162 start_codon:yes stop_codon:yes gene_type:complete